MIRNGVVALGLIVAILALSTQVLAQENRWWNHFGPPDDLSKLVNSKVKNPNAPFALIIQFKAKAGKGQALAAAFEPCIRETRKEPGSTAYYLCRSTEDSDVYVIYEQWKDSAAAANHSSRPYFLALVQAIGPLVDWEEYRLKVLLPPD